MLKSERSTSTQKYMTDYFYDGWGRIRTEMELRADNYSSEIAPSAKNEYFYTAEGDTVKKIRYHYDSVTANWNPAGRKDNFCISESCRCCS